MLLPGLGFLVVECKFVRHMGALTLFLLCINDVFLTLQPPNIRLICLRNPAAITDAVHIKRTIYGMRRVPFAPQAPSLEVLMRSG